MKIQVVKMKKTGVVVAAVMLMTSAVAYCEMASASPHNEPKGDEFQHLPDTSTMPSTIAEAEKMWGTAARLGELEAMRKLGATYLNRGETREVRIKGRELLEKASAAGDVASTGILGVYYIVKQEERDMHKGALMLAPIIRQEKRHVEALLPLYALACHEDPKLIELIPEYKAEVEKLMKEMSVSADLRQTDPESPANTTELRIAEIRKDAEKGDVISQRELGRYLLNRKINKEEATEGISWLRKAAQGGDVEAQIMIASLLIGIPDKNDLVERNEREALYFLERAVVHGNQEERNQASFILAAYYHERKSNPADLKKAHSYLMDVARQGVSAAEFAVGQAALEDSFQEQPQLTDEERKESFHLCRRAAEGGDNQAKVVVAQLYKHGIGTGKNLQAAVEWLESASSGGNKVAQELLQEQVKQIMKSAEGGDAGAQAALAEMYVKGTGVGHSFEEAFRWAKLAADQGSAGGQRMVGSCYFDGVGGVPMDKEEGIRWWKKAAQGGDAAAMFNIGKSYADGDGVPKDMNESVLWLRKSAEKNHADAKGQLGIIYMKGWEAGKWKDAGVKLIQEAAEAGQDVAQAMLGMMYMSGEGVRQNKLEGIRWLEKAANAGNREAQGVLEWISRFETENGSKP